MLYESKVRKIGNSQGILLEKPLCDRLGVACGSAVDIDARDGYLVVTPKRAHAKPRIGVARGRALVTEEWFGEDMDREIAGLMGAGA